MQRGEHDCLTGALDAIYDAAICPARWVGVLQQLGTLFDSHFVDIFARTDTWSHMRGRAIGLDVSDYEDQFLGVWCNRNIWGQTKPVRTAGEVLATWQMVGREDLHRSAIYNEYLRDRDLDEGMRIALWAGEGWIMDISLLRAASTGPFRRSEVALGAVLLPHLQRAAAVSRKLQGAIGFAAFATAAQPAFLVDSTGQVTQMNAAADTLLAQASALTLVDNRLTAVADATRLASAIAAAACLGRPTGAALDLPARGKAGALQLAVLPVRADADWVLPGPRGVLVVVTGPAAPPRGPEALIRRFGLTAAEAAFAVQLATGKSAAEIAASSGRSISTVRTHLARVMAKTRTQRQSQLVKLLIEVPRIEGAALPM